MRCNAIQCNTMQYNAIQQHAIQCNDVQYHAMQYNAIQCNTMLYNAIQCKQLWFYFCLRYKHISCATTRHVPEGVMSSCVTTRHVFLWHKKKCLLVTQEDVSSCDTTRHVWLWRKRTCILVPEGANTKLKTHHVFYMFFGWTNLRPPRVKHISLVYHVFPDPHVLFFLALFWFWRFEGCKATSLT